MPTPFSVSATGRRHVAEHAGTWEIAGQQTAAGRRVGQRVNQGTVCQVRPGIADEHPRRRADRRHAGRQTRNRRGVAGEEITRSIEYVCQGIGPPDLPKPDRIADANHAMNRARRDRVDDRLEGGVGPCRWLDWRD